HLEWVEPDPARAASLPRCSDRTDQKFLEVALCGEADVLLTYDRALLKMNRRGLDFEIMTPEAWARSKG
ncbi:MAG: putative toxin-antitoxin system toxin component, PIN family, partial [Casimicrobiaceae bacterium]